MSLPLDPGTRLGHYEVLSQLGAGAMAKVYLAHDAKLDRKVALKFLSQLIPTGCAVSFMKPKQQSQWQLKPMVNSLVVHCVLLLPSAFFCLRNLRIMDCCRPVWATDWS